MTWVDPHCKVNLSTYFEWCGRGGVVLNPPFKENTSFPRGVRRLRSFLRFSFGFRVWGLGFRVSGLGFRV